MSLFDGLKDDWTAPLGWLNSLSGLPNAAVRGGWPADAPMPDTNALPRPQPDPTPPSASALPDPYANPAAAAPAGMPLWGRLGRSLADNSAMLMALGGGLAGARTWGEGIGKGLTQAAQTSLEQQKQQDAQRAQLSTYNTLRQLGVAPQLALVAAQNPRLLSLVLNRSGRGGMADSGAP